MQSVSLTRGIVALWVMGVVLSSSWAHAQLVPGTGNLLNYDDLEDPNWGYVHNFPKSSKEEDENIRYPLGGSTNRMWSESPKRGSPDVVKRCETPAGGLPGSLGSLYLRTRDTGIPGHPMNKQCQDDFILMARPCGVGYSPNYVVRVFLPEFQDWEQRAGVSFGIRAGMQGPMTKDKELSLGKRFLRGGRKTEKVTETEPYYPGFFIAFNPMSATNKEPYAQILIRSDHMGNEVGGPKITQTGWWTFGMSVTPDARCHYYAHPGIADLTAKDHIYSSLPYNIRGEMFNTIFFNVCSADNGATWSTPWIIDDPRVYYSGPPVFKPQQQAQQPQPQKTVDASTPALNTQNASLSKEIPAAQPAPATAPTQPAAVVPQPMPQAPAAPANPTTSARPAAVQVPVVGITPSASDIQVTVTGLVPITAPSAAALQQPAPGASSPAGPVQVIALQGVPVRAPSVLAIAVPPAEVSGPAGVARPVAVNTIAPIPPVSDAPASFSPPAAMVPVTTNRVAPVQTATVRQTPVAKPSGIAVRSVSVSTPVSIVKPAPPVPTAEVTVTETPAPVAPRVDLQPVATPAMIAPPAQVTPAPTEPTSEPALLLPPTGAARAPLGTLSAVPEAEPEETGAPSGEAEGTSGLVAPQLTEESLPREELVPARELQLDRPAPLSVPTLSSSPVVPAVEAEAPQAVPAPLAPNPFDAKAPQPAPVPPAEPADEPPLTILSPAVDTTGADPSPVPTPPALP